ncbi:pyruvate kinase [uncultured Alistipes sp.]|jgi:pyruvate kinase|uniref:pyruvate kinase n=1 Tax=uncultured Alistipes sp. TaxID=538949 RepID=UPI002729CB10|nr:pyruvate kinase [uncultured Alistipes sp.]
MSNTKKTKIVATMSDFRCTEEFVRSLAAAGMDVVRINSAHVTEEGATRIVEIVHKVNPAIPIMIDTKGPEIRVTNIAPELGERLEFKAGDRVAVRGSEGADLTTREVVFMNVPGIVRDIPVGARMLIADGEVELRVVGKSERELLCEFVGDGALRSRKSVNVPGVSIDLPSVTAKDRRFIEWAIAHDVDFIAHSFVRSVRDLQAVQQILDTHGSPIKIISKIENQEGLDNIDEIIEASYGIMVARGDLGVELPAEAIPNTQRRIVEKCIAAKRPVIIATQMLYSMVRNPRPTRAEVSDVASAIYERVDAIMLSDETAMGDYPVEAVETMARIAREIERDEAHFKPMVDMDMVSVNHEVTAQLARSAVRASTNLPIRYVVLDTKTGRTGRYLAAFRGQKTVVAVCYQLHAQRILALSYGVVPILRNQELSDRYHFLIDAMEVIEQKDHLDGKDLLAIVGGSFGPDGGASYVEIADVRRIRERNEQSCRK